MSVPTITHDKPTNPTADVFIDGLSVICFSKNHDRCETGFLKCAGKDHVLYITIYKDGCKNVFWEFNEVENSSLEGATITINQGNAGVGWRYENELGKESDPEDYRWIPDIDAIYNSDLAVKADAADFLYTKLHIYSGVFYTKVKSTYKASLFTVEDPSKVIEDNYLGKVVGAAIDNKVVTVSIKLADGKEVSSPPLDKSQGSFWIHLAYRCPGSGKGDFLLNYDVLQKPKGEPTYDLVYDGDEELWKPCPNPGLESQEQEMMIVRMTENGCQGTSGGGGYKDMPPEDPPPPGGNP